MRVREARPEDCAAIEALHGRTAAEFPWPGEPNRMLAVYIAEDDGEIVAAAAAIRAVEIVMTIDPQWRTPGARWSAVEAIQQAMTPVLRAAAVDCGYCWVPPRMKGWMRRLAGRLGWRKSDWICMEHEL